MVVDFSKFDISSISTFIVESLSGRKIGAIRNAVNASCDIKYNEVSELSFDICDTVNGKRLPVYDKINGMTVIDVPEIGRFLVVSPSETNNGAYKTKHCTCYSLEYELTFKNITLENSTYSFEEIMKIIQDVAVGWSFDRIDPNIRAKYRTFDVSDENVYDFIKNTLQKSFECIFDFDTIQRKISVIGVNSELATAPVVINTHNLAKEIEIQEDSENIVTCISVSGADGLDIRPVNPLGSNRLYNLKYYMTSENFPDKGDGSPSIIDKYNAWEKKVADNLQAYQDAALNLSISQDKIVNTESNIANTKGTLAVIDANIGGLQERLLLNPNDPSLIFELAAERAKKIVYTTYLKTLESYEESVNESIALQIKKMKELSDGMQLKNVFSEEEYKSVAAYIKEGSVEESTFVLPTFTSNFSDDGESKVINNPKITIDGDKDNITVTHDEKDGVTTDIVHFLNAKVVVQSRENSTVYSTDFSFSAREGSIIYRRDGSQSNSFSMSALLFKYDDPASQDEIDFKGCFLLNKEFTTGNLSIQEQETGTDKTVILEYDSAENNADSGFFATMTSTSPEYAKHMVTLELYRYGNDLLSKLSQPSFSFSLSTLNFLAVEDFKNFRNKIALGNKIYLDISKEDEERKILQPVLIGCSFDLDDYSSLSLDFSDKYITSDASFTLSDLLEKSVSMGKKLDTSKYTYSAFVDSNAGTALRDLMNSTLDVSRNGILSSSGQDVTWDASGLRLRKRDDKQESGYEPEQMWMINNNILMTRDNWNSASIAIGKFSNPSTKETAYGVCAEALVGRLLAGENLVIESLAEDNSTALFRVDGNGALLHNAKLSIERENGTGIYLDPSFGFVIGNTGVVSNGAVDEDKAKLWADANGNLHLKGNVFQNGEIDNTVFQDGRLASSADSPGESGWHVEIDQLYHLSDTSAGTKKKDWIMQASGKTDKEYVVNGFSSDEWKMLIGDSENNNGYNFGIRNDGSFYANNANIAGMFTATSHYDNTINYESTVKIYSHRINLISKLDEVEAISSISAIRSSESNILHIAVNPTVNSKIILGFGGAGLSSGESKIEFSYNAVSKNSSIVIGDAQMGMSLVYEHDADVYYGSLNGNWVLNGKAIATI